MRGQKRVEDARKRAYARASIFLEKSLRDGWIAPQLGLARVAHHFMRRKSGKPDLRCQARQ
jgi:hypothetical protein